MIKKLSIYLKFMIVTVILHAYEIISTDLFNEFKIF